MIFSTELFTKARHTSKSQISKTRFTDKPAAFALFALVAAYFIASIIYFRENRGFTLIFNEISQGFSSGSIYIIALLFSGIFLGLGLFLIWLIKQIPVTVTHASFWTVMIGLPLLMLFLTFRRYPNITQNSLQLFFAFLAPIIIFGLIIWTYISVFNYIKIYSNVVKDACSTILKNPLAFLTYILLGSLIISLFLLIAYGSYLIDLHSLTPKKTSTFSIISGMLVLSASVYIGYSAQVFFSKSTYLYLKNPQTQSTEILSTSLLQTIKSAGTIALATLLYMLLELGQRVIHYITENILNSDISVFIKIIAIILLGILSLIIAIVKIFLDVVSKYALVYSSLNGTGYVASIKETIPMLSTGNFTNIGMIISSIIFSAFSLLILGPAIPILTMSAMSPFAFLVILAVLFIGMVGSALLSTLLTFEVLTYTNPSILSSLPSYDILTKGVFSSSSPSEYDE
ncbi:hypothetical protein NEFER03_1674 [Nematocida sp. LUAm3]|nr:hypothetical protein NEFER03_1674 [Nematocida sp. LUAm3]KAI5175664.1 hypothetical protein NEFER02_1551 [Nematocida sp. LUAm2]KAI5178570.1 hypothetical protein NEFER01_1706 [Nematocida sp. LUAm1]